MEYRQLGRTDIKVSEICLGSMTWGSQNSEAEGHAQIDAALEYGINFIDTAEMYPTTPLDVATQGDTESIIGTWVAANKSKRDDVIIATKIVGIGASTIRDRNQESINPKTIREAIELSLNRLQTDYIDLYQFHWPNRGTFHFRKNWDFDASQQNRQEIRDDILECMQTMGELVKEGKVREFGTSNESAWGISQYLDIAEANDLPRMVSVQNEYSLMARSFDTDMSEVSINEDIGLLAYSPLAAGLLTGKYCGGEIPEGSRRSMNKTLGGRFTEHALPAVDAYKEVAQKHGLNLAQMAISWCLTRPFMTSVIIGATSMEQLNVIMKSPEIKLSDDVMADIAKVRRRFPMPF